MGYQRRVHGAKCVGIYSSGTRFHVSWRHHFLSYSVADFAVVARRRQSLNLPRKRKQMAMRQLVRMQKKTSPSQKPARNLLAHRRREVTTRKMIKCARAGS